MRDVLLRKFTTCLIAVVLVAWSVAAMDRWPDVLAARRAGAEGS